MDDAASRRGVPALHRKFDEATAILAALMLFNLAHEQLAQPGPVPAERARERHHFVFKALGGDGVIGGQCADLLLRAGRATARELSAVRRAGKGRVASPVTVWEVWGDHEPGR